MTLSTSTWDAGVGPLTSAYLFSATVNLGKALTPIPLLEGGKRIVEPITGGTIYGPGFNATIDGGVAAPVVVTNNGTTTQIPYIYAYGHADDGSPFYIEVTLIYVERFSQPASHKFIGNGNRLYSHPKHPFDYSSQRQVCGATESLHSWTAIRERGKDCRTGGMLERTIALSIIQHVCK